MSPLGSLPRLELFLLRPAVWMLVVLFWDERFLLGLAMAGKGSVFALMFAEVLVCVISKVSK